MTGHFDVYDLLGVIRGVAECYDYSGGGGSPYSLSIVTNIFDGSFHQYLVYRPFFIDIPQQLTTTFPTLDGSDRWLVQIY
jgi:hypothetical protein